MSKINPGELRDKLKILYKHDEGKLDSRGHEIDKVETIHTLRCKKKTVSTKEFVNGDQNVSQIKLKFIVRKRDIDSRMLIQYKNKLYDIEHIHEIDDYFIELSAIETGGAGLGIGF